MDAMQILVVILSVFLALFLLTGIVLTILLIKVTKQIKMVTTVAEDTVTRINSLAANAAKLVSPAVLLGAVLNVFKKTKSKKR